MIHGMEERGMKGVFWRKRNRPVLVLSLILVMQIISTQAWGSLAIEYNCPKKFIGKVSEIAAPETPLHSLPKQLVEFKVIEHIEGDLQEFQYLEMLKNGPIEVEKGKKYLIEMNGNFICKIQKQK